MDYKKVEISHGTYRIVLSGHWLYGNRVDILDTTTMFHNYIRLSDEIPITVESFENNPIVKEVKEVLIEMMDQITKETKE